MNNFLNMSSLNTSSPKVLHIVEYPNELLRKETEPVTVFDSELRELVECMIHTMEVNNGVGLAAPQIGLLKQLAVVKTGDIPYVLVNPKVLLEEGVQQEQEGCLSFPGIYGLVSRARHAVVECQNEFGEHKTYDVLGFAARAFLHEIDHLHGRLLLDKFSPMKRQLVKRKLERNA